jgi:hypothetical protein
MVAVVVLVVELPLLLVRVVEGVAPQVLGLLVLVPLLQVVIQQG